MEISNWSFSQSFTPQFQAMRTEMESRIDAAKAGPSPPQELVQELSVSLAKAAKALADATGSIPSYDQKQYELQLKSIEKSIESLRASTAPKSKFAFKRKAASATPQPSSTPPPAAVKEVIVDSNSLAASTSTHLTLSSHSHKHLTRSSLPEHPQQTDLSIFDLDNCIVDLLPTSSDPSAGHLVISALHARNLTKCILLLPDIDGSALLHDLSQCTIVLGCHQFRMHSSKKIDVFLSISSNPIIEDCNGIRFAQYPATLRALFECEKQPLLFSVQDFSHIRSTPSPHFSMMSNDDESIVGRKLISERGSPTFLKEIDNILPQ